MRVTVTLYAPSGGVARQAASRAFARIAELEDVFSDWREESEVRRVADAGGGSLSAPLCTVLARALELARDSDGAFDPTVGPLVALWRESRRTGRLPEPDSLVAARARIGWRRARLDSTRCQLSLEPGTELDLGGIAKGFILDQALAALREAAALPALIEAGGDVVMSESPPGTAGWRFALPDRDTLLASRAVATSGSSVQYVEIGGTRYSHVLDPATGLGSTRGIQAIVIAPDGLTADGLATALTLLDRPARERLLARYPGAVALLRPER